MFLNFKQTMLFVFSTIASNDAYLKYASFA